MHKETEKRILIAGYYGFGNAGDEAILSAILAGLRGRRKNLEFTVVSAEPAETMASYHVQSIHWKDVDGLLLAAQESDLIVLGGGGLFQDYWGVPKGTALTPFHWGISYCGAIGMLAVLYQKPFAIYSVGVGPILSEEGKRLTRWTFDLASLATVRDSESRDLLIDLGIPQEKIAILPDPALTLELDTASAEQILTSHGIDSQTRPLLGVCIRNWAQGEESDQWKRQLATGLDQFVAAHDAQILFIPFQVQEHTLENDHAAALEIISMMEHQDQICTLSQAASPAILGGLLAHCQLVLGMRLHSLILAANAGTPVLALVYDPKVENFMQSFELAENAMQLASLTAEQLSSKLGTAWIQRHQMQSNPTPGAKASELKRLAGKTPALVLELLDKNGTHPFSNETVRSIMIEQSRALAEKEQERQSLSSELVARWQEIERLKHDVQLRDQEIQHFHRETQRLNLEIASLQNQVHQIIHSRTWKLAQRINRLVRSFIPVGSRREQAVKAGYRSGRHFVYRVSRAASLLQQAIRRHGLPVAILRGFRSLGIRLYHANKEILQRNKYRRELKQLEALISQHTGFFDIFHVPMGWNTLLFQRFQHISIQTARLGGLALYGGHPIVDRSITVYQKAADNLYIFDATNRQIVERVFEVLEKKQQPRMIRVQSIDLVTTAEDVNRFIQNGFTVVYEYIDEISPAITGNVPESVFRRHEELLKDERVIVVATSDQLLETVQRYRTKNFLLSTNGVDLDHWRIHQDKPPADLEPAINGNLIIGYHGALAKWIDYDLLREIANEGSYELVLIGHEHDMEFNKSDLKDHPRVHFLGSKKYFELNAYAAYYDIAILPFRKSDLTQAVSPVKIFEYMAARKPVVTTDLRECRKYKSCLVAESIAEFMQKLEEAAVLRGDPDYLSLLDKEAQENSWENKTLEILRLAGVHV